METHTPLMEVCYHLARVVSLLGGLAPARL